MSTLALASLLVGAASATVSRAVATAQSTNVLRYSVAVSTTERARVAVQVWEYGTASTTGWTTEYTATDARNGTVAVWGLKASTRYNYRVLVDPAAGANYTDARTRSFTTGALPANIPVLTATTYAGPPDLSYVLFHTRNTSAGESAIVISDPNGAVRWYQDVPSAGDSWAVSWYSEEENAIYGMVELDRIVRYAMDGTVTLDWDRSTTLADYVHHEIVVRDGIVYTLVVRESTDGTHTYAEDGIEGYDGSGNLVYEWWLGADGGLDTTTNPPSYWGEAGGGYANVWPGIQDWAHANSIQIREEGGSLKAYLSFRVLWQVAKVDLSTGAVEWLMGQNREAASVASNDFSLDASGVSSSWWALQHHAHFEDDGTFVLFDNGQRSASRGLEVSIDEASGVASIDRSVDFSDLVDSSFDGRCDRTSSAYRTAAGHMVLTCSTHQLVADFDSADSLQWTLDIGSTSNIARGTPLDTIGL